MKYLLRTVFVLYDSIALPPLYTVYPDTRSSDTANTPHKTSVQRTLSSEETRYWRADCEARVGLG